jgi:hypothetical protein
LGDGIEDLFFRKRPLVLSHVDGERKGIASLAVPHVRCNGRPSKLLPCGNSVVAVGEE